MSLAEVVGFCGACGLECRSQRRNPQQPGASHQSRPPRPFCWACWDRITHIRQGLALRDLDDHAMTAAGSLALYNKALAGVRTTDIVKARRRVVRAVHVRLGPGRSTAEVARMLGVTPWTVEAALAEG